MRPQTRKKLKLRAEGCCMTTATEREDLLQVSAVADADEAQTQLLRRCIVEANAPACSRADSCPPRS